QGLSRDRPRPHPGAGPGSAESASRLVASRLRPPVRLRPQRKRNRLRLAGEEELRGPIPGPDDRILFHPSFPSSAWERVGEKLRFESMLGREAELRDRRSQAELGNEGYRTRYGKLPRSRQCAQSLLSSWRWLWPSPPPAPTTPSRSQAPSAIS